MMENNVWFAISKIFALILIVLSILLVKEIYYNIQMYYANTTAYNNGLMGVLGHNLMSILLALALFSGSVLYLFNKKIGWVLMCANMILFTLFIILAAYTVFTGDRDKLTGTFFTFVFGGMCLVGLLGLYAKSTREAYGITKNTILIGFATALVLGLVYFLTSKIEPTVSFY